MHTCIKHVIYPVYWFTQWTSEQNTSARCLFCSLCPSENLCKAIVSILLRSRVESRPLSSINNSVAYLRAEVQLCLQCVHLSKQALLACLHMLTEQRVCPSTFGQDSSCVSASVDWLMCSWERINPMSCRGRYFVTNHATYILYIHTTCI